MHHLVIGALQERRIDSTERLVTFCGKTGSKSHRVLFGNSDVIGTVGKRLLENIHARPARHGGTDTDDLVVFICFLHQALPEHLGIGRRVGHGLGLFAGDHVEPRHGMQLVAGTFGRGITLALFSNDVHQYRSVLAVTHIAQDWQKDIEIVAVNRADIVEAKFLEQCTAGPETAGIFLGLARLVGDEFRQLFVDVLGGFADGPIGLTGNQPGQIMAHGSGWRCNRHVVIVQNDNLTGIEAASIVHRFVGHASRNRAITDHRHDIAGNASQFRRFGKAQACRDRR